MDAYEATKIVFGRIQALDPQNASKIMGFLLIQDHGEKDMIRLAHGPESLVHSVILRAKKELNLAQPNAPLASSSTPPTSPFGTNSHSNPLSLSRQSSSFVGRSSWTSSSCLSSDLSITNSPSAATMNSSAEPFYAAAASGGGEGEEVDLIDELNLQDHLSFLNEGLKSSDLFYQDFSAPSNPAMNNSSYASAWPDTTSLNHRRSCSVSDIGAHNFPDDFNGGFSWKSCLFYARGYCKNGAGCRFSHGESESGSFTTMGSSPTKPEILEEILRSKSTQRSIMVQDSLQQQQLMSSSPSNTFAYSPKSINFLQIPSDSPRGFRTRFERDFGMSNGINSPGSRQIYLTFPADSSFKEEDVSNYFSKFGPVQDVRIPYQQKRMFGFVTFDYPETVKLILAKGNPHFVCDARVLVKPYKEKGKIPEKHRKYQQHERGEFAGLCGSPTGFESRDPYDIHLGARTFYNAQDMWRSKLEQQADLQQAIELQKRRLMNLQLLDVKRNGSSHHRTLSTGSVISSSPVFSPSYLGQNPFSLSSLKNPEVEEENNQTGTLSTAEKDQDLQESLLEHNLPDSPFASPTKASSEGNATASTEGEKGNLVIASSSPTNSSSLINGSTLFQTSSSSSSPFDVAPPYKSCHFQVPRFASGHETIGM